MFDKEYGQILKALYESSKGLGFRDLMDITSIAQRPLRRRLNELKKKKYILVSNRPRRGQKKIHVLTKEGEIKARNFMRTEEVFDNILKSEIKLKDKIADMLSKMPLDLWTKSAQAKKLIDGKSFLIPYILAVIIRDFHEILTLSGVHDVFIGFKNGAICMIPAELLRKKGLLETVAEQIRREYRGL